MIDVATLRLRPLGEGVERARVVRWHYGPGEAFGAGAVLVTVETSKAAVEVEVHYAATVVEVYAEEGEEVAVGAPLARLGILR